MVTAMKPQKIMVLTAIRETLKNKRYYSIMDVVTYVNTNSTETTNRKEVIAVIVELIQAQEQKKTDG